MKILRLRFWFFIAVAAYMAIRCWRLYGGVPQMLNDYLTDLLCMPIVLTICLAGVRFVKGDATINAGIAMITVVTLQFIILFELVLPAFSSNYRGDWLDVLMYVSGALFFAVDDRQQARKLNRFQSRSCDQ
jgi:hypothetical protein